MIYTDKAENDMVTNNDVIVFTTMSLNVLHVDRNYTTRMHMTELNPLQ